MKALLEGLLSGRDLSEAEAGALLGALADAAVPDAWKGACLAALRVKGETPAEVRGLALAMRARAVPVEVGGPVLDTCGTGGDGHGSLNVSTAAALLLASMGHRVAKHGNRSVSSQCGSADVLEALGLGMAEGAAQAQAQLEAHGFAFLFAPRFHQATAAVVPVRRALGARTVFNLLGPLTNPARPTHQLIGVYSVAAGGLVAEALSGMPGVNAAVVCGEGGWDEATPMGPFHLWRVGPGVVQAEVIDPLSLGFARCDASELAGGDAAFNAAKIVALFSGERSGFRDAVLLNVSLLLSLLGEPADAWHAAAQSLDSGRALAWLAQARG